MNQQEFQQRWTDYLDGNEAAASDSVLAQTLTGDSTLREQALRDAELHGLLLALSQVDASEEAFVGAVIGRLMDEGLEVSRDPPATLKRVPPKHPGDEAGPLPPPIQTPQVEPQPPPIVAAADCDERASKNPRRQCAQQLVWSRHRWTASLCAAALLVLIGLGLLLVFNADSEGVVDRPGVAGPTPAPVPIEADARPESVQIPQPIIPEPRDPAESGVAEIVPDSTPIENKPPRPSSDSIAVRPPPSSVAEDPQPSSSPPRPPSTNAVVYGRIVDDAEAEWGSSSPPSLTGSLIRLRSGVVKIEMTDGAVVVVRGPADFALLSPGRLSMTLGQMAATVPQAAVGFAVQTPSTHVVDLGTEFVVDVDDAGATAVRVLRGEVEVAAGGAEKNERKWRLAEGYYKWVSGDGAQDLDWRLHLTVDEESFVGELNINGRDFPFARPEEFVPLYPRMLQELVQLRSLLLSARSPRAHEPFRAEISINGQRSKITSTTEYARTYRRVNDQLRKLWMKALQPRFDRNGGGFSGSFNINGEEFRINSVDDLLELQEELKRRAAEGFRPAPDERRGEKPEGGPRPADPPRERDKEVDSGAAHISSRPAKELIGGAAPKDARGLVQLALQAELDGRPARRAELLEAALAADPDYAPGRWHSGQVFYSLHDGAEKKWLATSDVEALAANDQVLAGYERIRAKNADDAAGNESIAKWCQRRGLPDRAKIHWARVLNLDPTNQTARARLQLREYHGRLFTGEQIARFKQQQIHSLQLRDKWLSTLVDWRKAFQEDEVERDRVREALRDIADAELLGLLETHLSAHNEDLAREVVDVARDIPDQLATESLVRHAVLAPWTSVRAAAAQELKRRPMHGYVPLLIDAMQAPLAFESWIDESRYGADYVDCVLKREGKHVDHLLHQTVGISAVPTNPPRNRSPGNLRAAARAADRAERRSAREVEEFLQEKVDQLNAAAAKFNEPIRQALTVATGRNLGDDPQAWDQWWNDYNEYYVLNHKPVVTEQRLDRVYATYRPLSCFPAGTLVWTQTGRRAIETVHAGDMVLSQHPKTGQLAYRLVLRRTMRPPASILEVQFGGGAVQTTKGHPFWLNGHGWQLAKFVRAGDLLHGMGGVTPVDAVVPLPQPLRAYNLVVSEFHSYFVGNDGILVHDNTPIVPPGVSIPGEEPAAL